MIRTIVVLAAVFANAVFSVAALGQPAFPTRPVRFIVPYPPGGTSDILARTIASNLTEAWGQQVVVENRPGGDGIIAATLVANAPADGHTIYLAGTSFVINPSLRSKMPFDVLKDFEPLALAAITTNLGVVHPSVPVHNISELVALAKAQPGKLNYAGTGSGTTGLLGTELLKQLAQINMVLIPYRGSPLAITDLLGGQVDLMFNGLPSLLSYVKDGRLRPIAVTSMERSTALPEVPTVAQSGYPGFEANTWFGVIAPHGLATEVAAKLNAAISRAVRSPGVARRLRAAGFEPVTSTIPEFRRRMQSDMIKWGRVVRRAGFHAGP